MSRSGADAPPEPSAAAGGAMVRARPAPDEPLARLVFRERISTSLWFVPALFVAGAFGLSKLTVAVDRGLGAREPAWLLVASGDGAEALTSTVAAAMLAFLAIVFSTTVVAIQLAGGQYSPRVIRIFVRRRLTHITLGVFLATFVFALNALIEIRVDPGVQAPRVTVSLVYLLVLGTLATFITFLHGMVRMLRVQYLLHQVTADGRAAMLRAFPEPSAYRETAAPTASASVTVRNGVRTGVSRRSTGPRWRGWPPAARSGSSFGSRWVSTSPRGRRWPRCTAPARCPATTSSRASCSAASGR
jgi:uncharacterized membrane protein